MPATTKYYQLGGFRPDIRWFEGDWNDKKLVDLLAGSTSPLRPTDSQPLELVLGIKHKGSSHLLLADSQASAFEKRGNRRPYKSTTVADYESVSPIYFSSASELRQKLGELKPKARKGKKEEPWDSSQANKAYIDGNQGVARGEFEHGRVLYRLLRKTINPTVYSLPDISWTPNLRILSFTCNLRAIDTRAYSERQREPHPLDYGWAEANVLDSQLSLKQSSAVHLIRAEDRLLKTGRREVRFEHGSTRTESQEDIASLAGMFFSALQGESTDHPIILLVHDENLSRNALRELGVDTSNWKSGIADLLRYKIKPESPNVRQSSASSNTRAHHHGAADDFERRQHRPRDRSKSPARRIKSDPEGLNWQSSSIRRSPSARARRCASVFIVDVQALYWTMMQSQTVKLLGDIAEKLGILEDGNTWCAGNEAGYIFQVWDSMVSGAAIDEQRASRRGSMSHTTATEQSDDAGPSALPTTEDSDEEFDPNDIIQVSNTAQNFGNDVDDSDTDYGSDY